jgi:hypothetical protein
LGFDRCAEAIGAVSVLTLHVLADGLDFRGVDRFHNERAIGRR